MMLARPPGPDWSRLFDEKPVTVYTTNPNLNPQGIVWEGYKSSYYVVQRADGRFLWLRRDAVVGFDLVWP